MCLGPSFHRTAGNGGRCGRVDMVGTSMRIQAGCIHGALKELSVVFQEALSRKAGVGDDEMIE